ncbi:MAG: TIGR04283 family arsenosugar biosynthesis glycosyltransferase [Rhodocyclaceae bacterium]|nr:TIGR04283 family arsenosugar biosynthesis glycosyltransferase [Rhodocyclaceae bacterium]
MDELTVSIVVPVLNEADTIVAALGRLQTLRSRGIELIVSDGGSSDGTTDLARPSCDAMVRSAKGRATQMNAAARVATGDVLVFLHADTVLPSSAITDIRTALKARTWGRFDVQIAGRSRWLPIVAQFMNLRSRLTGIATGDQTIFVLRKEFEAVGGYPEQRLMEDIELSRRLRHRCRPATLREKVVTAGRRWDENGPIRTILLMWRLRLAYWLGASPSDLAERYQRLPRPPHTP